MAWASFGLRTRGMQYVGHRYAIKCSIARLLDFSRIMLKVEL